MPPTTTTNSDEEQCPRIIVSDVNNTNTPSSQSLNSHAQGIVVKTVTALGLVAAAAMQGSKMMHASSTTVNEGVTFEHPPSRHLQTETEPALSAEELEVEAMFKPGRGKKGSPHSPLIGSGPVDAFRIFDSDIRLYGGIDLDASGIESSSTYGCYDNELKGGRALYADSNERFLGNRAFVDICEAGWLKGGTFYDDCDYGKHQGNIAVSPHYARMYIQEASIEGGDGPDPDSVGGPGMAVRNGAIVMINGHRALIRGGLDGQKKIRQDAVEIDGGVLTIFDGKLGDNKRTSPVSLRVKGGKTSSFGGTYSGDIIVDGGDFELFGKLEEDDNYSDQDYDWKLIKGKFCNGQKFKNRVGVKKGSGATFKLTNESNFVPDPAGPDNPNPADNLCGQVVQIREAQIYNYEKWGLGCRLN